MNPALLLGGGCGVDVVGGMLGGIPQVVNVAPFPFISV